jgi:hypothetical protein
MVLQFMKPINSSLGWGSTEIKTILRLLFGIILGFIFKKIKNYIKNHQMFFLIINKFSNKCRKKFLVAKYMKVNYKYILYKYCVYQ